MWISNDEGGSVLLLELRSDKDSFNVELELELELDKLDWDSMLVSEALSCGSLSIFGVFI